MRLPLKAREIEAADRLLEYFTGSQADYHIANLKEALEVVPDTGDWHGELSSVLHALHELLPDGYSQYQGVGKGRQPNQSAEQQRDRLRLELAK